jgi:intein/homing endonuclease
MKLSDTQWAYLAGIMDGEGSFSIARGGRKPDPEHGHPNGYINWQLKISIGNTNENLHAWLLENVGGAKYLGHKSKTDKHKSGYNWQLHGKENMKEFIEGVLPYLVLKKEQALLALESIAVEGKNPELRKEQWLKMKILNRKGKTVETNTPNTADSAVKIESELPQ